MKLMTMHGRTMKSGKGDDRMYITLRMSNNKKITGQPENIMFLDPSKGLDWVDESVLSKSKIIVNPDRILYARPAKPEEIKYASIHGW